MVGKLSKQLLISCGFLQGLHNAFNFIATLESSDQILNLNLRTKIEEHLKRNKKYATVTCENVKRGKSLMEFFTKHKLSLAGYRFNHTQCMFVIIKELLLNPGNITKPLSEQAVAAGILLFDELTINLTQLNSRLQKKANMPIIKQVCDNLSSLGFGIQTGKSFTKTVIETFELPIVNALESYCINFNAFKKINNLLADTSILFRIILFNQIYFKVQFYFKINQNVKI